jgi:hypothetical protein
MRLLAGAAVLGLLAFAPAAHASRLGGAEITWPAKSVVQPGEKVTVKIASKHRRARVALLFENRALKRATLRNGTFTATIPPGYGKVYRLRVRVGDGEATRALKARLKCATTAAVGSELRLSATSVRAGDRLQYEVYNPGPACLRTGAPHTLERLGADGAYVPVPAGQVFIMMAFTVAPGEALGLTAELPADLAPGTYRLTHASGGQASFTVLP